MVIVGGDADHLAGIALAVGLGDRGEVAGFMAAATARPVARCSSGPFKIRVKMGHKPLLAPLSPSHMPPCPITLTFMDAGSA